MLKNNKLQGFTLYELLITMVISSIAIAVIFSSFTYFYRNFSDYSKISTEVNDWYELEHAIKEDLFYSEKVYFKFDKIVCLQGEDEVSYFWEDDLVIRSVRELETTFNCHQVAVDIDFMDNSSLVKRITFHAELFSNPVMITQEKRYGLLNFMK
jgi:prepilin-type N-terminal cleavage/methylation domain-containing protein